MTPTARYLEAVERGELEPDAAQRSAVRHTQRLYDELVADGARRADWRRRLLGALGRSPPAAVRGLYLWGGVGRGKTRFVNELHAALPVADKRRIHFHSFMQLVHRRLRELGTRRDPLPVVAGGLAREARVLCVDEFHVADITDAMLLGRLLGGLFERGVTLVATSNIAPRELYRDGLQREHFLPAIELIEAHTEVVHLDGGVDYRLRALERAEIYHCPLDERAEDSLAASFEALGPAQAPGEAGAGTTLEVAGRPVAARRLGDGVAWFDFEALCETPRSSADYAEIACRFHTVLVSSVPRLDDERRDRTLRFIHLVDELYDHRVNLIVSAAAPPGELYVGKRLAQGFARTRSRLVEMQTRDYLAATHLA